MIRLQLFATIAFFCLICVTAPFTAWAQVGGCKDPAAINYDPTATVNNGGCTYSSTFYAPVNKVNPLSSSLTESSGLQWAGNYLWTHNDGGSAAAIYRIDTTSNAILQTVNLAGTTNVDWEDMSFDGTHFYIGDFGNNSGGRRDLKIYKFPLSAIPTHVGNSEVTIPSSQIEIINFTYGDQPQPAVATSLNNTNFDCEAMVVDDNKIHLFSKAWVNKIITHYVINGVTAGTYTATPLETLTTTYLVTAASKVPGSNILVLLGYESGGLYDHFMHLLTDFNGGRFFNGNKRLINLPNALNMAQAEGITFRNSTYGYISSEAATNIITVSQRLKAFHTDAFTPVYVLPARLKNFKAATKDKQHEVSWSFTEPVQQLRLLSTSNGTSFTTLHEYTTSMEGGFIAQGTGGHNCYQLAWKNTDGSSQHSNIVCIKSKWDNSLQTLALRRNGELFLTFNGNEQEKYLLRLLNTQGQIIAQAEKLLIPGSNIIRFQPSLNAGSLALLQAIHNNSQHATLISVQ